MRRTAQHPRTGNTPQALPENRPASQAFSLRLTVALPILGAVTVVILIAIVAATLWHARQHELAQARTTTLNLSEVLKEQTARTLQNVDTALIITASGLRSRAGLLRTDPEKIHDSLRETLIHLPYVRSLWVLDARGAHVYDSDSNPPPAMNFSDREYFRWHLADAEGLFVGKPVDSRIKGEWFLAISRRISDTQGRFAGVVVAAVDPRYFERFYDGLNVGRNGAISIRHVDGELIARIPRRDDLVGNKLPFKAPRFEGTRTIQVVSAVDGVERIYTSRPVEAVPLVVTVGICVGESLAAWRQDALALISATLFFSLLIGWLTWLLTREVRRRETLTESLRKGESLLRQVVESLPVGVFVGDRDGNIFLTNTAARRIWAADEELKTSEYSVYKGRWTRSGVPLEPGDWAMRRALSRGETSNSEMVDIECFDGTQKTILNWAAPIRDEAGKIVGAVAVNEDISSQRLIAEELGESEARFEAMFEYSIEAMLISAPDGRILSVNREALNLLGYSRDELLAHPRPQILAANDPRTKVLLDQREKTGHVHGETTVLRKDGVRFPGEVSSVLYRDPRGEIKASLTIRDISQRKQAEEKITFLAYHDELTGLSNRAYFSRTLEHALSRGRRHAREIALLMVDLDGFKEINDRFGHEVGDGVLQQVARRLRTCVRDSDTVARLGGDEFVLMLEQPGRMESVETIARKVLAATSAEIRVNDHRISVTASIGIACYPGDGNDLSTLLRAADSAMYHAKDKGKNRWHLHGEA